MKEYSDARRGGRRVAFVCDGGSCRVTCIPDMVVDTIESEERRVEPLSCES